LIIQNKKLNIPREELLFVMPEPRLKLFYDLINEYKKRRPELKLRYAYLNFNEKFGIDYLLVFEGIGAKNGMPTILYDCPYIYTNRAIPGYRYCKRENLLDDFFEDAFNFMTTLSKVRFDEYVNSMINLSIKKDNPLYWRKEENSEKLVKGLIDLALYYVKKS